jgi:hypothetical protein
MVEKPARSASGTKQSGSPHSESKPQTSSPAACARESPASSGDITSLNLGMSAVVRGTTSVCEPTKEKTIATLGQRAATKSTKREVAVRLEDGD